MRQLDFRIENMKNFACQVGWGYGFISADERTRLAEDHRSHQQRPGDVSPQCKRLVGLLPRSAQWLSRSPSKKVQWKDPRHAVFD